MTIRSIVGRAKRSLWQSDTSVVYLLPRHPLPREHRGIAFVGLNQLRDDGDSADAIELPDLYDRFRQQGDAGLVAVMNGDVAGWMWMRKGPFLEGVGFGTAEIPSGVQVVRHVEVYHAFRSNGIGRSLLREAAKRFRTRSHDKAIAFVNSSNSASIRAFEAAGYIADGRIRFHRVFGRPLKVAIRLGDREES
ncbi:MAG TPA: GNAT family N-acetyltransferase [Gemmatimonadaceae bacterium]|nr:GNAT family N-acetyltransferase [Gemmatimonadaceae bacterium]